MRGRDTQGETQRPRQRDREGGGGAERQKEKESASEPATDDRCAQRPGADI